MARRSFRDRFLTPKVAAAMMSPLGIVLAGAGAAVGIVSGVPLVAAAGIGVAAWAGRVLAAVPRNAAQTSPQGLSEPWRGYAEAAQDAKRRFDGVVASATAGPIRDRLSRLADRLDDGVQESWRIARRGHELVNAIGQIDTAGAESDLAELRAAGGRSPAVDETARALESQLASAERLGALATRSRDRLRLLDAQFDELVARAVEVSVGSGDSAVLDADVDALVTELEALRAAMEETDRIVGLPPPEAQTRP